MDEALKKIDELKKRKQSLEKNLEDLNSEISQANNINEKQMKILERNTLHHKIAVIEEQIKIMENEKEKLYKKYMQMMDRKGQH